MARQTAPENVVFETARMVQEFCGKRGWQYYIIGG